MLIPQGAVEERELSSLMEALCPALLSSNFR